MSSLKTKVKKLLEYFDVDISRHSALQRLLIQRDILQQQVIEKSRAADDLELIFALPEQHSIQLLKLLARSVSLSQLRQDLLVLSVLNFKRNGFFVEFGATNGVDLSNTYLLEKEFGWNGILAEPAKCWHQDLQKNRTCLIDKNCVWIDSISILKFNEASSAELSTINSYNSSDFHGEERKQGKSYDVKTISLMDLLDKYNAPHNIDYLSIDTEGSEFEILSKFDFDKYRIMVITCEHNFTPAREKIFKLLTQNGYARKYEKLSRFDDWYVKIK